MPTTLNGTYQGILNIPLFVAPYSVPPNNTVLTNFQVLQGSQRVVGGDCRVTQQGGTGVSQVNNASLWLLEYGASYVMNINGGYNIDAGTENATPCVDNDFSILFGVTINAGDGEQQRGYSWSNLPFGGDINLSAYISSNPGCFTVAGAGLPLTQSLGPYPIAAEGANGVSYPMFGGITTANLTLPLFVNTPNNFNADANVIDPPSFLTGIGAFQALLPMVNIPDYAARLNYFWSLCTDSIFTPVGLYMFTLFYDAPGKVATFSPDVYNWFSGIASVDAAVAAGNFDISVCSIGVILMTEANDYFISKDGSKFWQLNYMSQGAAPQITPGYSDGTGYSVKGKTFDASGVFWYTGTAAYSSDTGMVTPLFSFGEDLAFINPTLPPVNPLKIPCYDPCIGEDIETGLMPREIG